MTSNSQIDDEPPGNDIYTDDLEQDSWDDEFGDDGDFSDDLDDDLTTPSKKKSSKFNHIVIGIAVVVGIVIVVTQLGGKKTQPSPAPQQMAAQETDQTTAANTQPEQDSGAKQQQQVPFTPPGGETGFLNDPSGLQALEEQYPSNIKTPHGSYDIELSDTNNDLPPMPAPITQPSETTGDILTPLPKTISMPENQTQQETMPTPVVETDSALMHPPENQLIETTSEQTFSPEQTGNLDRKLETLLERLDTIETRINQWDSLQTAAPKSTNAGLAEIQNTLKNLENRIDSLAQNKQTQNHKISSTRKPQTETPKALSPTPRAPTPEKRPDRGGFITPLPDNMAIDTSPTTPIAPKSYRQSSWILKAAQPDEAYVSQQGSRNIIRVRPGDNLAGVGKVKAIRFVGGRWVVEGTQGRIQQ